MTAMRPWLGAVGAILLRDLRLTLSYRFRLVGLVLNGLLSLTLFYYVSRLVRAGGFASRDDYFAYVVVGLVILQILNATLGSAPGSMRQEITTGTMVRLLVSPFGAACGLVAMLVFPVLLALFAGLVILCIGGAVYGMHVAWSTVPLALPATAFATLAFAPISLLLLAATVHVKQTARGATWVTALAGLVSGLYFPTSLLPAAVRWTSEVQPFTPATDVLRHVLVGSPLRASLALDLGKLVGFAAVLLPLSIVILSASLRLGQRRGTILEY